MSIETDVLRLAERQHAAVATRQIRGLGGDRFWIARQVRCGRWEVATSRVIRIAGSPRTAEQRLMISVLHAGPTAMASHESAAWLWRLPGFAETAVVLRDRPHGGHCTLDELACRGRSGITTMRQVLAELPVGSKVPATGLEARFEEICHNAGIRELERQLDAGGHSWLGRVDFVLRRLKLLIEVDSRLYHTSPLDVANDEARDKAMLAAGWRKVLRVAEEDIWRRPWFVVEQVRAAIQELEAAGA